MFNQTKFEWIPKNLTIHEMNSLYASIPLRIIGAIICIVSGMILSSNQIKEKPFLYIRIEFFLMAVDHALTSIRSGFFANMISKPPTAITNLQLLFFVYLPSPIESSVLVANIIAVLSRLLNMKQKNHLTTVLDEKPNTVLIVSFVVFAVIFSYQFLAHTNLFHVEFFKQHYKTLGIVSFFIRDGLLLGILIALNLKLWLKVRSSMKRKYNMMGACVSVRNRANKAKTRMNVLVVITCLTLIIGRMPIFVFMIMRAIFPAYSIPGLISVCIMTPFLSYFFKFIFFVIFNLKFRNLFFEALCIRKFNFKK